MKHVTCRPSVGLFWDALHRRYCSHCSWCRSAWIPFQYHQTTCRSMPLLECREEGLSRKFCIDILSMQRPMHTMSCLFKAAGLWSCSPGYTGASDSSASSVFVGFEISSLAKAQYLLSSCRVTSGLCRTRREAMRRRAPGGAGAEAGGKEHGNLLFGGQDLDPSDHCNRCLNWLNWDPCRRFSLLHLRNASTSMGCASRSVLCEASWRAAWCLGK